MQTQIIYEDNHIIVVHKPAGLATQNSRVGQQDVVSELKNYLGQSYLGVIHRLDQPVDGLLVFAKDHKAASGLCAELSKGDLNKEYYALVFGQPESDEGELTDRLVRDFAEGKAQVLPPPGEEAVLEGTALPGSAVLQYSVKKRSFVPEPITLLDVRIFTGRFHQIRAQLSHAGMPILGDHKYGTQDSKALSIRLGIKNVALCAYMIEFIHPVTGEDMKFQLHG